MSSLIRIFDGDTNFAPGMNSVSQGLELPEGSFPIAVNMINRGGVLRARPGFDWRYTLPDGELQGFHSFIPRRGFPQQVAVVAGQVYVADYPFREYRAVPGATMSPLAKQVFFAQATKSVEQNSDGSIKLVEPKNLLMLQDGINPPAFYDGSRVTAITGDLVTPQGSFMAWDGRRLWVARDEKVFASDIANPLSFVEQQFNTLGGLSFYIVPGKVTGMGMTTGVNLPQLLVFTATTTTTFQSNIADRTLWDSTPQFQRTIFPSIGCVSQRSIVSRSGEISWYSQFGWTTLDTAAITMQSVETKFMDGEMIRSKSRLSNDLSRIAAGVHDNFLMVSVPHSSLFNAHTWVHDASPDTSKDSQTPDAWASVWTGVQPVEWSSVEMTGTTRIFFASKDKDGKNRVYEAFGRLGKDNGVDLPWSVEFRPYTGKTVEPKYIIWAELFLGDILGQLDLRVSWSGAARGRWKSLLITNFKAGEGNVDAKRLYESNDVFYAYKAQSRQPRTQEAGNLPQDPLTSCNIELETIETIDSAYQIRLDGSGQVAIKMVRVALDVVPDPPTRTVAQPETEEKFVRYDGAASKDSSDLDAPPESFTSAKTARARFLNFIFDETATVVSILSQADADKRAQQAAAAKAEQALRDAAPKHLGGIVSPSVI